MNSNDERSAAQIQDDVRRTRGELDATLNALEHRLAPGQLMEDGLHYLRTNGATEYVANLGDAAKRDPIPLALVGVGLAWLMLSARRVPFEGEDAASGSTAAISSGVRDAASGVKDTISGMRESVSETVANVKGRVSQATQRISDTVQSAGERTRQAGNVARQGAEYVRSSYEHLVNEQPLAIGAIGLALGAAFAAAAPRTRQEDRLLGEASDRVVDDIKVSGREQLDKVKTVVRKAHLDGLDPRPAAESEGADVALATR
ncbi:MAG: DUF3618 domain-containing protein [Pseudomonadota bacterium]|nr:DUF3618 domain-containing protein [Pseudomonadota bacterium]